MRPPRVRSSTWEGYEDAVDRLPPTFGHRRLGEIRREDVEAFLVSGQTSRPHHAKQKKPLAPLSPTTMNYSLSILRMILRDAVDRVDVTTNVAVRAKPLPNAGRSEECIPYLTPESMTALLAVAPEPYATLYRLTVNAGLRRGEVLALKWDDLDLAGRRLHVRRSRARVRVGDHYKVVDGPPKTKSSATVIDDLSPSVVQALLNLPAGDDPDRPYVFRNKDGGPFDPDDFSRTFERHVAAAGIRVSFHALRHTCAVWLIAAGEHPKAIQTRMRHAGIGMTMDTYGHLMAGAFKGMGERMEAWLKGQQSHVQVASVVDTIVPLLSQATGPLR